MLPVASATNDEARFFKYPRSIIPIGSTDDYNLVNASSIIMERTKGEVFKSFKFSTTLMGFIFERSTGNVTKVLMRARGGSAFKNDIGELQRDPRFDFYEQIPVTLDNQVFMYKFFEMQDMGYVVPKDYKCLTGVPGVKCEDLPRCMGQIRGECLVSTVSRDQPLITNTKRYHQKRLVHQQVQGIKDNFILFWSVYGTSIAVLILIPSLLKFITCRFTYKGSLTESKSRISAIY